MSNTAFINQGRAQFLCGLIIGAPIGICVHIFQTIRKTATRLAARGCIPFCSLIMKFILREGINPPSDGKMLTRLRPISMFTKVIPLKHQRVHTSLLLLCLLLSQRHMYVPHPLRMSSLNYNKLALRKYSLILKLIGWVVCLKVFRSTLREW